MFSKNFSQNEPNSASGIGSIRTMQGDLRNIRASKGKIQSKPAEQSKPQINNQASGSFSIFKEPVAKKAEPVKSKIEPIKPKTEPKIDLGKVSVGLEFPLEQKNSVKTEKAAIKEQAVAKPVIKKDPLVVKKDESKEEPVVLKKPVPEIKRESTESVIKKDAASKIINNDEIDERIKQIQNRMKPFSIPKEVSAPENIVKVSEPENKAATQYVASLSKSAKITRNEDDEKLSKNRETSEEEYLPPELRLYRSTGNTLSHLTKDQVKTPVAVKPIAKQGNLNEKSTVKEVAFYEEKKPVNKSKIIVFIILLLVVAGAYFVLIKKVDLGFISQWLPKGPVPTPVATVSPSKEKLNISSVVYINDPENLNLELLKLKDKNLPPVNIISIALSNKSLTKESLINKLNIVIPENVKNSLNIDNSYLLYFSADNRLGLVFEVKEGNKEKIINEMRVWNDVHMGGGANPIAYALSPLLLGNFFQLSQSVTFDSSKYKEVTINYMNLPDSRRSIDYGIIKNFFTIVTSKQDMSLTIDELTK